MANDNSVMLPAMVAAGHGALRAGQRLTAAAALRALAEVPHLTCHSGFLIERLGQSANAKRADIHLKQKHSDVAELFAFACPAQQAVPTPRGLARALMLHREQCRSDRGCARSPARTPR